MLLNPGQPFDYNGQRLTYPDIKLVYWAGGNPFHHHQDINRLRRAFFGIETLVVHEIAWTATARHADIVLPCTMTLEREDIGATPTDQLMLAMHRLAKPFGQARDDYDIFADLAERLGKREAFTEGRSTRDWLRHIYATTQKALAAKGLAGAGFRSVLARRRARAAGAARRWRHPARLPRRSARQAAADAERQDRDLLEDHCGLRLCRLPRPSGLAAAVGRAGNSSAAASRRQPAGDAAAQPVRFRRPQRCAEAARPRGDEHPPG